MSIDLVICGYHRNGEFKAIININVKFTPGNKITIIFKITNIHCKKENIEILGNKIMYPIGDRPNNICARIFLGCSHEGNTQFQVLTHGCPIKLPREKTQCSNNACFCHWRPIFLHQFPYKWEELHTLVLWLHFVLIQMEITMLPNGN